MSAVAYKLPNHSGRPQLRLVPPVTKAAAPPSGRRRALVACAAVVAVVAVALVLHDRSRPSTVGSAGPADASAPASWTVRPGDTLWSIARSLQPAGDLRPLVHRLVRAYGERPLQPGETLAIPG